MHATISDQITDLVQNAIEAGASHIDLEIKEHAGKLDVRVADNGCGISPENQARVWDPFHTDGRKHAKRKVGLGLAFLRQMAEATGGTVALTSQPGQGATLTVALDMRHVDLPPLGDMADALAGMMAFGGDYELAIIRERDGKRYGISRRELAEALGGLDEAGSIGMAKQYMRSHEQAISGERI